MKFDLKYLEKLAKLMNESELTEMQLEDQEQSIVLKREKQTVTTNVVSTPVVEAKATTPAKVEEAKEDNTSSIAKTAKAVKSPMVGTFYAAPSSDDAPFVQVGDTVSKGQVVCIVEAMKLMNEIESDYSGKVVEICLDDGQPVEYGQVLMYIE